MSRNWIGLRNSAVLLVIVAAASWLLQCGPAAPEVDSGIDEAAQLRVLEALAERVIVPTHQRFAQAAVALEWAAQAYAASLAEADRSAAQAAWRAAMEIWQRAELMQIGPSAPSTRPGGTWLRDAIYSFPVTVRCRIDQETLEETYADLDALAAEPVSVRGLDAIEYLLFAPGAENACSAVSPINAEGLWAALGADEVVRRRAAYASALATLLRRSAEALVTAWDPDGGGFQAQLTQPGDARVYPTARAALNAVTDAMFYLDLVTKDRKIAAPAGLRDCTSGVCPELVESPLAAASNENVAANLRAFEAMFLGGEPGEDGDGFDDLLASLGEAALAERMRTNLEAALGSVEGLAAPLASAVVDDREAVLALHAAVKLVTDDLKGPMMTALQLTIPAEGAGDTD